MMVYFTRHGESLLNLAERNGQAEPEDGDHLSERGWEQARGLGERLRDEGIERIVVGLPVHAGGEEGDSARAARAFGDWLSGVTGRPVVYYDERYTTSLAEEILRSRLVGSVGAAGLLE